MKILALFSLLALTQFCSSCFPFFFHCGDECTDVEEEGEEYERLGANGNSEFGQEIDGDSDGSSETSSDSTDSIDLMMVLEPHSFMVLDEEEYQGARGGGRSSTTTHTSLDIESYNQDLVCIKEHDDNGMRHRIFTPDEATFIVSIKASGKEIWRGEEGERCIFAQSYTGEHVLVSMEIYNGERSVVKRFEKRGDEWIEVRLREFSLKLNKMMTSVQDDTEDSSPGASTSLRTKL